MFNKSARQFNVSVDPESWLIYIEQCGDIVSFHKDQIDLLLTWLEEACRKIEEVEADAELKRAKNHA